MVSTARKTPRGSRCRTRVRFSAAPQCSYMKGRMHMEKPCLICPKSLDKKTGYGRVRKDGKLWMAHRLAYYEAYGTIDPNLVIDHLCHNRACVEPTHLQQTTRALNSGRHKPDCTCSGCNPESWMRDTCINGHQKEPGKRCKVCQRTANREHMRRKRAGA